MKIFAKALEAIEMGQLVVVDKDEAGDLVVRPYQREDSDDLADHMKAIEEGKPALKGFVVSRPLFGNACMFWAARPADMTGAGWWSKDLPRAHVFELETEARIEPHLLDLVRAGLTLQLWDLETMAATDWMMTDDERAELDRIDLEAATQVTHDAADVMVEPVPVIEAVPEPPKSGAVSNLIKRFSRLR